jgi:hypothetical protein
MLDTVVVVGAVLILALFFGALILPAADDPWCRSSSRFGQPITANRNGEYNV